MISIPRDTYAPIPSRKSAATDCTPAAHDKINAAFAFGAYDANGHQSANDPTARGNGIVLTMRTINCLIGGGLKFNGSALVNFDGFDKVVGAIGSVYMCVDEDVWSVHYNADGTPNDWTGSNPHAEHYSPANRYLRKHYAKGECRDFLPWEALDYARQRDDLSLGDSDYGRQRHQQQLLKAIMKKIASPNTLTNLQTIGKLRDAAGQALTLNFNDTPIEDFVLTLSHLRADDIVTIKTYAGHFDSAPCVIGGMTLDCQAFGDDLKSLIQAARDDKVFDFLAAHPDWLDQDNNPSPVTPTVTATK
jgi:anionic cell wall polymer biosynthesis LytR-Cps2A-Psr (LCP) family protein